MSDALLPRLKMEKTVACRQGKKSKIGTYHFQQKYYFEKAAPQKTEGGVRVC